MIPYVSGALVHCVLHDENVEWYGIGGLEASEFAYRPPSACVVPPPMLSTNLMTHLDLKIGYATCIAAGNAVRISLRSCVAPRGCASIRFPRDSSQP